MTDTAHGRPMTEAVWQRAGLLAEMLARLQCSAVALRLDQGDAFARASRRCLACPCPSQCRLWLRQHASDGMAPPEFCANADFLAAARAIVPEWR